MPLLTRHIAVYVGAIFLLFLSREVGAKVVVRRESTMTQNKMVQLQMALRAYHVEYGRFPRADIKSVFAILGGDDVNGENPKRIVFYEYRQPKKFLFWTREPGDLDTQGRFLDGWGNPFQFGIGVGGFPIRIRSLGPNGRNDNGLPDDRELVIIPNLPRTAAPPPPEQLPAVVLDIPPRHQSTFRWYLFFSLSAVLILLVSTLIGLASLLRHRRRRGVG